MKLSVNTKKAVCINPECKAWADMKFQTEDGAVYKVGFEASDISHGRSSFGDNCCRNAYQ